MTAITPTPADFRALAVSVIYVQVGDQVIFRTSLRPSGTVRIDGLSTKERGKAEVLVSEARTMWGDQKHGGFHAEGGAAGRWIPKDPDETTTEWAVRFGAPGKGYPGGERIQIFDSEEDAVECVEGQNVTRAVIVSRQVTDWVEAGA